MAMRLSSNEDEPEQIHDINVTPFIDVMLVLLIIFMIAAPLATVTVPLDLPVSTNEAPPDPPDPIMLSLQGDLKLSLGEREIARSSLVAELDRASRNDKQARIFLRADKSVPYGDLMTLMDELRRAGYLKVGLVTLDQASGGGGA